MGASSHLAALATACESDASVAIQHGRHDAMPRIAVRPYLIAKDEAGVFRITVRTTRFNSQGYPLITATQIEGSFPTLSTARAYARETFRAEASDIALK
jgi:hypothetical protein